MPRKVKEYWVTAQNRDMGKCFVLTEMPAARTEKWAMRAFLALARAGVDIPENISEAGFAGIARLGFSALGRMDPLDAEQLMNEMFDCIQIRPDPKGPHRDVIRALIEDDIEEVGTRLKLRAEVFELHTGFSLAGSPSTSESPTQEPAPEVSSATPISRKISAR